MRRRSIAIGAFAAAVGITAAAGLAWRPDGGPFAAAQAQSAHGGHGAASVPPAAVAPAPAKERTIIYYKDPTGKPDFSPEPRKDAQGRDYLPVYADEEAPPPVAAPVAAPPASQGRGRILFYRNPMGLPDTSPVPKKDPMGMDYVPVYEGDEDNGPSFRISLDKVQKLGVRTEPAVLRALTRTIRAVGTVQLDERRIEVVAPKFEGYVDTLRVDTTGQAVQRGQALFETYSPDLVLAQEEYLAASKALQQMDPEASREARASARLLVDGALQRLRNWDISAAQLQKLQRTGTASRTLTVTSPAQGVVLEKTALRGQRFMPGEMLYRIADLSTVWVIAEVYEQDLASLRTGEEAKVTFNALPGQSFGGKVTFIYPILTAETRTVKVRIELPNRDGRLKPSLYGTVEIANAAERRQVLAVPDSALLDSGTRKVVLLERGEGRYEPREVHTGGRADGYVEILDGVAAGDKVVVSANFLIDAESNLRAALQSFKGQ